MPNKGLGAKLSVKDTRDIHIQDVVKQMGIAMGKHPSKNISDISALPHEDQKDMGTCVGQAEGKGAEFNEYKEKGVFVPLSHRFVYVMAKRLDNDLAGGQGTSGSSAAKVLKAFGIPRQDLVPDDNDLPYGQYVKADTSTDEILQDAQTRRIKGYAFCYSLDDLKTGIDLRGFINASVMVGTWDKGNPLLPLPEDGLHRAFVYGYEDAINPKTGQPDTKMYDFNSWGNDWNGDGNGWWWWSDYENYTYDMIAYVDMPDELVTLARSSNYQFIRTLKYAMSGDDVKRLQMRLSSEPAVDGQTCYRYKQNGKLYYGSYFGDNTEKAVERYQIKNNIVTSGTPSTTGFGQMGPATMKVLNGQPLAQTQIEKWADAIQNYEGWAVGSRAYRDNNPGNIRYYGLYATIAIGEDRGNVPAGQSGYCIFKDYDSGRAALEMLLGNACTGKSQTYKPEMTLLQFYMKYAPSTDNNWPSKYAAYVASELGVSVDTKIQTLV